MFFLPRSFYERDTILVAQELLGKILVRTWQGQILSGIITETEAYCGTIDPASHAYKGPTPRNKAMFGPAGHSYVYFIYGNHHCLNIVAKNEASPSGGVLVRALIPLEGITLMQKLRKTDDLAKLTYGPGTIGQALHITLQDNHHDVTTDGELYITEGLCLSAADLTATPRIGISKGRESLWRFVVHKDAGDRIKKMLSTLNP